jgi:hypothetical protein
MVLPSSRAGVPVLNKRISNPRFSRLSASRTEFGSPILPPGMISFPRWMRPFKKVPVVMTTAVERISPAFRALMPEA